MTASVRFLPADVEVEARRPEDALPVGAPGCVLGLAVLAEVPLAHACGGQARCGTCRVEVLDGGEGLSAMGEEERDRLGTLPGAGAASRLGCRAVPRGEGVVTVQVPQRPREGEG